MKRGASPKKGKKTIWIVVLALIIFSSITQAIFGGGDSKDAADIKNETVDKMVIDRAEESGQEEKEVLEQGQNVQEQTLPVYEEEQENQQTDPYQEFQREMPVENDNDEEMVLITNTGKKYHRYECTDGNYFEVALSTAKAMGLTPCKKCYGG